MSSPLHRWLGRLSDPASDPVDASERDFVEAHRLEPLAFALGEAGGVPQPQWATAYMDTLAQAARHLREAERIGSVLTRSGIAHVWTRGVFHGALWYGDMGRRPFTDLDLLIDPGSGKDALSALDAAGYTLRGVGVPSWYYRRYHLHWPLVHERSGILMDAHWAVDHPLSAYQADLGEVVASAVEHEAEGIRWMGPRADHDVILACLHLAKECAGFWDRPGVDPAVDGDAPGRFISWLDLGLIVASADSAASWEAIRATSERWGVRPVVEAILAKLRGVESESGVGAVNVSHEPSGSRVINRLGHTLGFRPRRLSELDWRPRQVMFAAEAAVASGAVMAMSRWQKRRSRRAEGVS